MRIGEQLVATRGDRFRQFFKPSVFMKFPRNQDNCIPSALFFTFVFRKVRALRGLSRGPPLSRMSNMEIASVRPEVRPTRNVLEHRRPGPRFGRCPTCPSRAFARPTLKVPIAGGAARGRRRPHWVARPGSWDVQLRVLSADARLLVGRTSGRPKAVLERERERASTLRDAWDTPKVNIRSTRSMVSPYDALGRGYLKEKDMENFIFELIPALPQLNQLQEEFYPFYVFTAVRKFFFFLDPKRTGRIRIRDLLSSQIIIELFELRQEVPAQDPESNWFSMQSALKVYMAYLDMDADQNGMLSKSELSHYGSGMLTQVFIDRVFEEYQTYRDSETGEREMDYKTFLDFVLAMENKNSRQAIQYFWKLIDIHHEGWIDGFVINYFFRAVLRLLQTNIPQSNKKDVTFVDDVKDEIFDMAKAKTPGRITLQDLINCRQGGTVLSMLIDAAAFWRYDNRETLIAEPDPDDEDDLKG